MWSESLQFTIRETRERRGDKEAVLTDQLFPPTAGGARNTQTSV